MIDEKELALARKVAVKVGSRWSSVEVEDLTSELTLWLYTHADAVKRYRMEDGGQGKLFIALRRTAGRYCVKEQEARTGGPLDSDAPYTLDQIERALPYIFEDTVETVVSERNGHALHTLPSEFGRAQAVLLDIRIGYEELPPEHKTVLALRFRDGMTYSDIGTLTGITDRGAKRRVARALQRIQESLSLVS